MKRIAFISRSHAGSLFPLMKRFLSDGYAVDYYCLHTEPLLSLEASDCLYKSKGLGLAEIPKESYPRLDSYFSSDSLHIYSFRTSRPFESNFLLYCIAMFFRLGLIKKFCHYVNSQEYELVNIIGRYQMTDLIIYCKLIKHKLAVSLHEVCNHRIPDFEHPTPLIKYLLHTSKTIVVYSQKSFDDVMMYKGANSNNVKVIPFGKFETYNVLINNSGLELPSRYVLFIGTITKYKGLDLFYNATSSLSDFGVKYVVAGAGDSEYFELMAGDNRYMVIHKFLSVYEFADLIKNAEFIICPYKTASQSGIPFSAYVFNTPIIASDLMSFRSVIEDNEDGELFRIGDADDLIHRISRMLSDTSIISMYRQNLELFEIRHPQYDWNIIFNNYQSQFLL